jgi:hypothetical protein
MKTETETETLPRILEKEVKKTMYKTTHMLVRRCLAWWVKLRERWDPEREWLKVERDGGGRERGWRWRDWNFLKLNSWNWNYANLKLCTPEIEFQEEGESFVSIYWNSISGRFFGFLFFCFLFTLFMLYFRKVYIFSGFYAISLFF